MFNSFVWSKTGCGHNAHVPPMEGFTPTKNVGVFPPPKLQTEPCEVNDEL